MNDENQMRATFSSCISVCIKPLGLSAYSIEPLATGDCQAHFHQGTNVFSDADLSVVVFGVGVGWGCGGVALRV